MCYANQREIKRDRKALIICPLCEAREQGLPTAGLKHKPTRDVPALNDLGRWMDEGGCEATDGCWVEPDGRCPHGHSSWLLRLGLI